MDILPKLKLLYTNYLEESKTLYGNNNKFASLFKWLFGMPHNPGDKELNPKFYDSAAACLKEFQSEPYTPEEALSVVTYVLRTSVENADTPVAGLTLTAVQGLLTPLVPSLPPQKAAELADWYKKQYPYRKRFPAQENLLKALNARK